MKEKVVEAIENACLSLNFSVSKEEINSSIIEPKPEFGDISSTIAFTIAKKTKKNPNEIANQIAKAIKIEKKLVEKTNVAGGYINFSYGKEFYKSSLETITKNENFGAGEKKEKKVVIEYPSVNPNKPLHVGHLRNALLGNSIANILEFAGYNAERQNFVNDLGLQVAQSIWGYLTLQRPEEEKFDHLLGKQYVEIAKAEDEKTKEEVRRIIKKLEEREPALSKRAREICEECVRAQLKTNFTYGIYQDLLIWESDIVESKLFEKAFEKMQKSGIFIKEEAGPNAGCLVTKLDEKEFPSLKSEEKVIIRSDGTATYTAKDIAFQLWKFGLIDHKFKYKVFLRQPNEKSIWTTSSSGKETEFGKADVVINVIGMEQSYLQDLIKYILKKMNYPQAENYFHLSYEHVVLPEGEKFKGRLGTWIGYTADELAEEAIKRATTEVEKRIEKSGIKGKEKERIAKIVGIGAIKFSFLRVSPSKKVVFDFDRAISFEGDTGPYLQYAYVRAKKIIDKLKTKPKVEEYKFSEEEKLLIKKLSQFPEIVQKSAKDLQCHYLADYAIDIADLFNKFYEKFPVIKAEEKERKTRAAIVSATATVLKNTLSLLGIEVPEKM